MLHDAPSLSVPVRAPAGSFGMALRILPPAQRAAMFGIHAFCRAVDDIADGPAPPHVRRAALARWRADVDAAYAGAVAPRLAPLAPHIAAYDLARADFHAVIDGMLMDAQDRPICAPPADLLDLYCDRVAAAVGRLSVRVSGLLRHTIL